jgi:hypothetical protein
MEKINKPLSEKVIELDYCPQCSCGLGFVGFDADDVKNVVKNVYKELINDDEICRAMFQQDKIKNIIKNKFGFDVD